jgi:hypothetical protein
VALEVALEVALARLSLRHSGEVMVEHMVHR